MRAHVLTMVLVALVPQTGRTQEAAIGQVSGSGPLGQMNSLPGFGSGTTDPFELTGRVINARTNAPIARALVTLGQRTVMTNHDGIYSFPQVTTTSGVLTPWKQGFYRGPSGDDAFPHMQRFTLGTPVNLMLYPEAVISGVVTGASGEGLPNFTVVARHSNYDENGHHWTPSGAVQTNTSGIYRMVVPPGHYTVQARSFARPHGNSQMYLPVSVPADSTSIADALHIKMGDQVRVDLRPDASKGYLVSITSDAEAGRRFPRITAYYASGLSIPLAPMPERGDPSTFRVVLPNGTYRLSAVLQSREGMSEGEAQVTVAGRDVAGLTMHYSQTPRIPVEVAIEPGVSTDNLTIPVARSLGLMLVSKVTNGEGFEQTYALTTDLNKVDGFAVPHGRFHLQARSMGQWYVTSADYGGTNLLTDDLVAGLESGGQTVRIRISSQTASLSGTVKMGDQPVQAYVYLLATMPTAMPVILIQGNLDGSFSRSSLPPGSYRVLATQEKITEDPRDPASLARYLGKVQTVSLSPNGKDTLNLEAVPAAEMLQ